MTNKHGLPDHVMKVLSMYQKMERYPDFPDYDISVTELIAPSRIGRLSREMKTMVEPQDVSEIISLVLGNAFHQYMEHSILEEEVISVEKKMRTFFLGKLIAGTLDAIVREGEDLVIYDYKTTSVWSYIDGFKPEWKNQLEVYRWLAERNGYGPIRCLKLLAIYRDWSQMKAKFEKNYPPLPFNVYQIPLSVGSNPAITQKYVERRLREHFSEGPMELCTPEERWRKPVIHAVMKRGRKTAVKLFPGNPSGAADYAELKGKDHYVEIRPEENPRCERYCPVASVCEQYRNIRNEG